jgi:hypothetical protein
MMPCWTRVESQVEFLATSTDTGLLHAALTELGYTVTQLEDGLRFRRYGRTGSYTKATGRLEGQDLDTAEVKRGYSEQAVGRAAQKNGWRVSWSTNAAGNRQAQVLRRGE